MFLRIIFRYLLCHVKQRYNKSHKFVMKSEQIKNKIRYGDYITLSEMLNTTPESAKMRIRRNDKAALSAVLVIIENREKLIRNYKQEEKHTKK